MVSTSDQDPAQRFAWVLAWAILTLWGLWAALSLGDYRLALVAVPDESIYRAVIERVHAGENYYDAADEVLGPTTSLFNYRLPTYAWALALLPDATLARWIFPLLSTLVAAWAIQFLGGPSRVAGAMQAFLILGAGAAWCFYSEAYLTTELWAGLGILASVCAYAQGCWLVGAALGFAALLWRELSLVYCLVAILLAWRETRPRELLFWAAALTAFAAMFTWHALEVAARRPEASPVAIQQWLPPPGYPSVLMTARMNVFLWPLPVWVAALLVPLAFLGLTTLPAATGRRLLWTSVAYALAFAAIKGGHYWGLLYTPLLALGLVRGPGALVRLFRALLRRAAA